MGARNDSGVGLGIRLTRSELRRLEALAEATGRKPSGVIRALIGITTLDDRETLERIRSGFHKQEEVKDGGV